jgi:transposase
MDADLETERHFYRREQRKQSFEGFAKREIHPCLSIRVFCVFRGLNFGFLDSGEENDGI